MKKVVLFERELRGDAAGNYRSKALEYAMEEEHLKNVLLERELRGKGKQKETQEVTEVEVGKKVWI